MITIEALGPQSLADGKFEQLYGIYEEALPAVERKPAAALRAMLAAGRHDFIIAGENHDVKGFAIIYRAPHLGFSLLEYMATRSDARGQGIGARLLSRTSCESTLLIEIESSLEAADNTPQRLQRIAFYERQGARIIEDFSYICPLPGKMPEMMLMAKLHPSVEAIARDDLKQWIEDIYEGVYGCSPADQRIAVMLANVVGASLPLRPLTPPAPRSLK